MSRKRCLLVVGSATAVAGALGLLTGPSEPTRAHRRRAVRRCLRDVPGRLRGLAYRARGDHPSDDVDDRTLEDRIRSTIGPITHRLDQPHIHVMVHAGVATLHGDVATDYDATRLTEAVLGVWGVRGVDSHLHVGLLPGDTRPSAALDSAPPRSAALRRLLHAVAATDVSTSPLFVLRAVLANLLEQIPPGERRHVLDHLPDDVRTVAGQPTRRSTRHEPWPDPGPDLIRAVTAADPRLDTAAADAIVTSTLAALAELLPEERQDISAVLPGDLRRRWLAACAHAESAAADMLDVSSTPVAVIPDPSNTRERS